MNPLSSSPSLRKKVYTGLWSVGLALTGAQVWVAATDAGQPTWLTGALAVFPAVASYVGYTAGQNVNESKED